MQALFLALYTRNIAVLKKPLYFHNQGSTGHGATQTKNFALKIIFNVGKFRNGRTFSQGTRLLSR